MKHFIYLSTLWGTSFILGACSILRQGAPKAFREITASKLLNSDAIRRSVGIKTCDSNSAGHYYQVTFYESNIRLSNEDFSFRGNTTFERNSVQDEGGNPEPVQQTELYFFENGGVIYHTYPLSKDPKALTRNTNALDWANRNHELTFAKGKTLQGYIYRSTSDGNNTFHIALEPKVSSKKEPKKVLLEIDFKEELAFRREALDITKIAYIKEIETQGSLYTEVEAEKVFNFGNVGNSEQRAKLWLKIKNTAVNDSSETIRKKIELEKAKIDPKQVKQRY